MPWRACSPSPCRSLSLSTTLECITLWPWRNRNYQRKRTGISLGLLIRVLLTSVSPASAPNTRAPSPMTRFLRLSSKVRNKCSTCCMFSWRSGAVQQLLQHDVRNIFDCRILHTESDMSKVTIEFQLIT